ncbi:phage minor head protein [Azonexus sp.]|uniref:phage head morphogenesis protein n=1 Tax=Azonexus sp. TaxID=1872668 RepID=UPI0027B9645C|nr:phage minor head protein [Azonexus sp.]
MADIAFGFGTPFSEQLDFFRQKLNLPSERWDDIKQAAHDRAFIVAGAMKADLLADLRGAVDKAIGEGRGLDAFRKDFKAIVAKHGWTGWTGEGTKAGEAWRTRVIWETNMATSYAAGRYRQLTDPEFLTLYPYWRYRHADWVANPRMQHVSWNNLTLPHYHLFWKSHFPPNGWGCHCWVTPVSAAEYAKAQAAGQTEPPAGWDQRGDTGQLPGIAPGFDYAPGASIKKPLTDFISEKLIKLDAPIGADMYESLRPALIDEMRLAVTELVDVAASRMKPAGEAALVHVVAPRTIAALAERNIAMESADVWLRDEELIHALRHTKDARGATLPLTVWRELVAVLDGADPYLDTHDSALVYAFDMPDGVGKVLVRVNYADKVRVQGKRSRLTSNFVRTGGVVKVEDIRNGAQYVKLEK